MVESANQSGMAAAAAQLPLPPKLPLLVSPGFNQYRPGSGAGSLQRFHFAVVSSLMAPSPAALRAPSCPYALISCQHISGARLSESSHSEWQELFRETRSYPRVPPQLPRPALSPAIQDTVSGWPLLETRPSQTGCYRVIDYRTRSSSTDACLGHVPRLHFAPGLRFGRFKLWSATEMETETEAREKLARIRVIP